MFYAVLFFWLLHLFVCFWANNFSYLSILTLACLRLFLLFLIAEKVSKKASRLEKYKKPVFRLFCKLVLEKHSNIQNRPFLKTGFLSAFQKSAKEKGLY
ncbi:hypothetical protein, partial [Candidatus Avelusimicrobium sp.]